MIGRLVSRFLFYPMRYPAGDWNAQSAAQARDVWLTTRSGVRLHCWWFPHARSRFVSLFLHGNAGNVTHRVAHAEALGESGSAALVLDYRGYGKSSGQPSEQGLYEDAFTAYEWLRASGYDASEIVLHGESIGAAIAVELAARVRCAALILEAPFSSLSAMANLVFPFAGAVVRGFDTLRRIGGIAAPVFVIHGDADEIVPISQGRRVFEAANQPKQFWAVAGAGHNDLLFIAGDRYVTRLREFYALVNSLR